MFSKSQSAVHISILNKIYWRGTLYNWREISLRAPPTRFPSQHDSQHIFYAMFNTKHNDYRIKLRVFKSPQRERCFLYKSKGLAALNDSVFVCETKWCEYLQQIEKRCEANDEMACAQNKTKLDQGERSSRFFYWYMGDGLWNKIFYYFFRNVCLCGNLRHKRTDWWWQIHISFGNQLHDRGEEEERNEEDLDAAEIKE